MSDFLTRPLVQLPRAWPSSPLGLSCPLPCDVTFGSSAQSVARYDSLKKSSGRAWPSSPSPGVASTPLSFHRVLTGATPIRRLRALHLYRQGSEIDSAMTRSWLLSSLVLMTLRCAGFAMLAARMTMWPMFMSALDVQIKSFVTANVGTLRRGFCGCVLAYRVDVLAKPPMVSTISVRTGPSCPGAPHSVAPVSGILHARRDHRRQINCRAQAEPLVVCSVCLSPFRGRRTALRR